MFVILNPIGAGMAVVAVFFSELLVSIRSEHFGMVMGLTAITEDLLWRIITLCRIVMRHEEKSAPLALIGAKSGGQIFFVPIWVWGTLCATGLIWPVGDAIAYLWSKITFW